LGAWEPLRALKTMGAWEPLGAHWPFGALVLLGARKPLRAQRHPLGLGTLVDPRTLGAPGPLGPGNHRGPRNPWGPRDFSISSTCGNQILQGRSQGSTGVTVVRGPRAQGDPGRVPRGSQEGSQKASGPGKGCESIGRCSLFLRKRKKIRKKT
jgi:hypothetical protein